MVEIIGVRFKSGGKQYYFDPAGLEVQPGQGVIVETSRGLEYGECAQGNTHGGGGDCGPAPAPTGTHRHGGGREDGGKKPGEGGKGLPDLSGEDRRRTAWR